MSIITMATSKGGAGKTTVAQVLLGALASRGYHVAAIDADFNHTLSNWARTFAAYPIDVQTELDETKIVPLAAELEAGRDAVVIDTAGAAAQATVFAIGCADLVIVPIQLSSSDVVEAIKTIRLVRSASEMTRREILARVLFTDYQPNTNIAAHTEREVKRYGLPTMRSKLHRLVAFKEMTFTGEVPAAGAAGAQVEELLGELGELGILGAPEEPMLTGT
jgi:chromosome partitioning protein